LNNIDNIWKKCSLANLQRSIMQMIAHVICVITLPCKNSPCGIVFPALL